MPPSIGVPWRNFLSPDRVWNKVPEESTLIFGRYQNLLTTQIGRRKPPCKKNPAQSGLPFFLQNTGLPRLFTVTSEHILFVFFSFYHFVFLVPRGRLSWPTLAMGWLGSRVVSVLGSGAEGPGSNRSRDAVG